ncbi:DNA-binding transcriptional LysR family regulator [Bradyrhizobium elkanii]
MSVSLKQIRYFVAAAETGRISQAAIDLNVSQSAVTAAIQQLEATVCARLLERAPNGVTVTMEGSRFLSQGRQILAAVAEAVRDTQMSAGPLFGTVRVGVTYTVSGYFLPRHQMRFKASFPGITIELFEAPRDVLERALVDGALDLAVMLVSNLRDNAMLTSETLLRSPRRLWLAPEHPLTRAERVHLADIATYPYVMLTVDEAKHTSMRYWNNASLEPKTVFRTSSVEAVRSMVAGGMGNRHSVRPDLPAVVAGGAADRDPRHRGRGAQHGHRSCLASRHQAIGGCHGFPRFHALCGCRRRAGQAPRPRRSPAPGRRGHRNLEYQFPFYST